MPALGTLSVYQAAKLRAGVRAFEPDLVLHQRVRRHGLACRAGSQVLLTGAESALSFSKLTTFGSNKGKGQLQAKLPRGLQVLPAVGVVVQARLLFFACTACAVRTTCARPSW